MVATAYGRRARGATVVEVVLGPEVTTGVAVAGSPVVRGTEPVPTGVAATVRDDREAPPHAASKTDRVSPTTAPRPSTA